MGKRFSLTFITYSHIIYFLENMKIFKFNKLFDSFASAHLFIGCFLAFVAMLLGIAICLIIYIIFP